MTQPTSTSVAQSRHWFVIWSESRAEKKVAKRLTALGLSPWLPVVRERHRWSDRWREVECALFPGYLFVLAANADWHKILQTPGVLSVIKEGGKPALLADSFVAALRDAIGRKGATPEAVTQVVGHSAGDEVVVKEGLLRGVRGIVRERKGERQLVIWVAEIGRGIAFTIKSAQVEAIV